RNEQSLSESQLTNGIERLRRDRQLQVYFLQGHGELPLDLVEGGLFAAVSGLEASGFGAAPLNLPEVGEIPEDANVIVIASPDRALFPAEINALEDFLETGGGLMVLLDPDSDRSLYPLLNDWGIEIDERLIVDMSGRGRFLNLSPATPLITDYGSHPIVADFGEGVSVFPLAQPVVIETDEADDLLAVPLAMTPPEMWAERDVDEEASLEFDPERDLAGPLNLGIAVERLSPDDTADTAETLDTDDEVADEPLPRLVVFGNAGFATNGWFEQQLNGDLFLNSMRWLAKEEDAILAIRPRELANRRIDSPLSRVFC
ncbi:MAG: ABC transporter, partial [Spirulinaceae cyanobacterium RM2_2_10]|nr:ABC transporter [Spirulinaceae cyanobacterium RM2_2_10]